MKDRSKTWVVNTRIDIRTLATLMKFYEAQGDKTRKKSTAIRLAVEHFRSLVVLKHPEFDTPTYQAAIEYLEYIRVLDMESDFTSKYALVKELQKEGLEIDLKPRERPPISQTDTADMMRMLDKKLRQIPQQEDISNGKEKKEKGGETENG